MRNGDRSQPALRSLGADSPPPLLTMDTRTDQNMAALYAWNTSRRGMRSSASLKRCAISASAVSSWIRSMWLPTAVFFSVSMCSAIVCVSVFGVRRRVRVQVVRMRGSVSRWMIYASGDTRRACSAISEYKLICCAPGELHVRRKRRFACIP